MRPRTAKVILIVYSGYILTEYKYLQQSHTASRAQHTQAFIDAPAAPPAKPASAAASILSRLFGLSLFDSA